MKGVQARQLATQVLVRVETDGAYVTPTLAAAFNKIQLSERDRAFATFLVQGVLRHRDELDETIGRLSTQPLAKMSPLLRNVLRLGIFQLKYASDIPVSAVVNTATEIGKSAGHIGIGRFVSAVLRAYIRKDAGTTKMAATESASALSEQAQACAGQEASENLDVQSLSKRFSMPPWLVTRWLQKRGMQQTLALLEHSQSIPPLTVRACNSGITTEALLNLFTSHGIKARRGHLMPDCLIIEDRGAYKGPVDKIPGYKDGLFVVQDEAAAFASQVVAAQPGNLIIDLCAAPGGKSVHMAEMMENKGRVVAVDVQAKRLEFLKETRQRVGLTNIEIFVADGTTFSSPTQADKVLLDAPCTGTGVINRRADLRFQRKMPDLASLVALQRQLLDNAARLLKPGGILVYSTCSIEPEENEDNLEWFLQKHKDFTTTSLRPFLPDGFEVDDVAADQGWIQLLPNEHGTSGFFVARLQKQESTQE